MTRYYCTSNLHVHSHIHCIACVIIKEWKQKDDLFYYTESDTQSSYVFDPFNAPCRNDSMMMNRLSCLSVHRKHPNYLFHEIFQVRIIVKYFLTNSELK